MVSLNNQIFGNRPSQQVHRKHSCGIYVGMISVDEGVSCLFNEGSDDLLQKDHVWT